MAAQYCPACGAQSETQVAHREGQEIVECATCALPLSSSQALAYQPINEILFADDSDLLRVAIEDILVNDVDVATRLATALGPTRADCGR